MNQSTNNKGKDVVKKFRNNKSYKFLRESMEIIGNEERFLILDLLNTKPCLLSDIGKKLGKSQPSISHHVRLLEQHKFIYSSKRGKFKEYSISREKFVELLTSWNQWFQIIRSKKF